MPETLPSSEYDPPPLKGSELFLKMAFPYGIGAIALRYPLTKIDADIEAKLPDEPFVLAATHTSAVTDVFAIELVGVAAAGTDGLAPIIPARSEWFEGPLKPIVNAGNGFPVERPIRVGQEAVSEIEHAKMKRDNEQRKVINNANMQVYGAQARAEGRIFSGFPGGRSKIRNADGTKTKKTGVDERFLPGLAGVAVREGMPVVTMATRVNRLGINVLLAAEEDWIRPEQFMGSESERINDITEAMRILAVKLYEDTENMDGNSIFSLVGVRRRRAGFPAALRSELAA